MEKNNYNTSALFLMPLLGISKAVFRVEIFPNYVVSRFINSFLRSSYNDQYNSGHYLHVLSRCTDKPNPESILFESELLTNKNYVDTYPVKESCTGFNDKLPLNCEFDVFVFTFDADLFNDIELIKQSKYSQISESSKKLIIDNGFTNLPKPLVKMILYRDQELIDYWFDFLNVDMSDQEVYSRMDFDLEILNSELLKKYDPSRILEV